MSLLQRALGIGYGRAARLIDFMAEDGIVGTYNGSQAREVLITLDQWSRNDRPRSRRPSRRSRSATASCRNPTNERRSKATATMIVTRKTKPAMRRATKKRAKETAMVPVPSMKARRMPARKKKKSMKTKRTATTNPTTTMTTTAAMKNCPTMMTANQKTRRTKNLKPSPSASTQQTPASATRPVSPPLAPPPTPANPRCACTPPSAANGRISSAHAANARSSDPKFRCAAQESRPT